MSVRLRRFTGSMWRHTPVTSSGPSTTTYSLYTGYAHLGAGLTVGLSNLASGLAIGMCGACGVQDSCRQPKLYIGMVLIWSFGSALGLYGLIVALIIVTSTITTTSIGLTITITKFITRSQQNPSQ